MKLLNETEAMEALLREYVIDNIDWADSADQIDALLSDSSEATSYSEQDRAARVERVLARSEKDDSRDDSSGQLLLFATEKLTQAAPPRIADLRDIVRSAFLKVHGEHSTDRVIADPDLDALFIQACWGLGARATQCELNQLLMNARKAGVIGKTDGVRPYRVPPSILDAYLFASEFAIRVIQDREYFENQRAVALDRVLCDPEMARDFEARARSIAPGYSSLDYRWAALCIRKGQNRTARSELPELSFQRLGRSDSIRPSRIDAVQGFFWMKSSTSDVYIGHAENIREQVERMLELRLDRVLPDIPLLQIHRPQDIEFAVAGWPSSSPTRREPLKTLLVQGNRPKLNVLQQPREVA